MVIEFKELQMDNHICKAAIDHTKAEIKLSEDDLLDGEEALLEFGEALRLAPGATTYLNRGHAHTRVAAYYDATADYGEVIRLDPQCAVAYKNRGNAYMEMERIEQATEDFDEAIRLDPQDKDAFQYRGQAYALLGLTRKALHDFDKAIGIDFGYADAHISRGRAHLRLGRFERAIEDFERVISLEPRCADAFAYRGLAHTFMYSNLEAHIDLETALELGFDRVRLESIVEGVSRWLDFVCVV